ncbi:MAG: biotin transporter BioY [Clostridia bacterium]|nr:biotin transporter BioY [Clostridia bacterium]
MKIKDLVFAAIFTSLLCIAAPICIPVGPVPLSLTTFVVFVSGAVLGAKKASLSILVYILLGIAGLPVFSGFSGGLQRIISPLGGFIISYIPCVLTVAYFTKDAIKIRGYIFAMSCAALVCYLIGTLWFAMFTNLEFFDAVLICVLPFVIADILKIISAAVISSKLKPFLKGLNKEL